MQHIYIFLYTLTLIIATGTAFHTRELQKTSGVGFLRPYFRYIVFFIASVAIYQIFEYVYVNLIGGDMAHLPSPAYLALMAAAVVVETGMALSLLQVIAALGEWKRSRPVLRLGAAVLALFGAALLVGLIHYVQTGSVLVFRSVYRLFYFIANGMIIIALAFLLVGRPAALSTVRRKAVSVFGGLYLARYIVFFTAVLIANPASYLLITGILLLTALIPYFWLSRYFPSGWAESQTASALDKLSLRYGISPREREVIELLLEGRSYREIQEALFISFNTVKNHVYNIYKKLGVKSRGRLVRRVMQAGSGTMGGVRDAARRDPH